MITVAGEALIDLIVDPAGHVDPRLGGAGSTSPARWPGSACRWPSSAGLSGDRFGQLMRADLDRHGVKIAVEAPSAAPTTLALVDLDPAGVPSYHFYLDGTSAAAVGPGEAVLPEGTTAVHVGSLGLVMEPVGTSTEHMVVDAPDGITVMLDPNCRPRAIASRQDYLDRLMRIMRRADIVKTSTEDLAYLFPGQDAGDAAAELLGPGARPAWSSPTARRRCGPSPAAGRSGPTSRPPRSWTPWAPGTRSAAPSSPGGSATAWAGPTWATRSRCAPATQAAIYAAVVTTTRRGAEPPWAYELAGHDGWRWLPPSVAAGCRG